MKKFILLTTVSGLGLTAGGLAMLFVSGYDVTNADVWRLSWDLLRLDPKLAFESASRGEEATLFRGLFFTYGGLLFGVGGLAFAAAYSLTKSLFASLSAMSAKSKIRAGTTGKAGHKGKPASGGASKVSLFETVSRKFGRDKELDLDAGDVSGGSSSDGLVRYFIKTAHRQIVSLARLVSQLIAKLMQSFGKANSKMNATDNIGPKIVSVSRRGEFPALSQWFKDVQSGTFDMEELASRAREFQNSWDPEDMREFAASDPINGAFVTRLVKSWAERDVEDDQIQSAAGSSDREQEREAVRAAMRALKKGEITSEEDEPTLDLEEDFVEVGFGDVIIESVFNKPGASTKASGADVEEPVVNVDDVDPDVATESEPDAADDAGPETVPDAQIDEQDDDVVDEQITETRDLVGEIKALVQMFEAFDMKGEDWPDHMASAETRDKAVSSLAQRVDMIEMISVEPVLEIAEKHKDRFEEFKWILDYRGAIEVGLPQFLQEMAAEGWTTGSANDDESSDNSGDVDEGEGWSDPDAGEDGWSDPDADEEDATATSDDVEMPDVISEDLDVGSDVVDGLESELGDVASDEASDAVPVVVEASDAADHVVEVNDVIGSGESEPSDSDTTEVEVAGDDTSSDAAEAVNEEVEVGSDVEAPEETAVAVIEEVVEEHVPVNVAVDDLREMEISDEIPSQWGKALRKADATEAALGKYVFDRSGSKFKTVGVAHLVGYWRKADGAVRLNIVLKYLPEGNWVLSSADGAITARRENGDYVSVPAELLSHKEFADASNVVHFHGPGSASIEETNFSAKLLVLPRVLSAEEISEFIKS